MIFKILTPDQPLGQYINSFVYYRDYDPEHSIEKLLPDGSVNIIIELDEIKRYTFEETLKPKTKCIKAWISGMQNAPIFFSAEKRSCMFVVQFRAGGSYPFLHIPAAELNDLIIDAELIFGPDILELREKLLECASPEKMFVLAGQWFFHRAKKSTLPEGVVNFATIQILEKPTINNLQVIASKTGYSQKQFIQIFKKFVGLTPKSYQRIIRFNKTLAEIEKYKSINWQQISFDCGYYDQAHFINEFKYFSGINPSEYLLQKGEYLNYIPIYEKK